MSVVAVGVSAVSAVLAIGPAALFLRNLRLYLPLPPPGAFARPVFRAHPRAR